MDIVNIVVIVASVATMAYVLWASRNFFDRVSEHIEATIGNEVRLQDDRIRKRLERIDDSQGNQNGQEPDNYEIIPGRPVRRS